MATPYTFNQLGALITMLAAWVWFHIFLDMVIQKTKVQPWSTEVLYMELIVWIFVLLYAIRFKWSYIVGIVGATYVLFIALFFDFADPSIWRWMFSHPNFSLNLGFLAIALHLTAIACIYFSYRSYKELTFSLNPIDLASA